MELVGARFTDDWAQTLTNFASHQAKKSTLAGFTTSFLAILVSQIGDKTFFLAMIMATKYNKMVVFFGAYGALFIMTVLSAVFGGAVTSWISPTFTNILVTLLFFYFGGKMIYQYTQHKDDEEDDNSELQEVQIQLQEMEKRFIERQSKSQIAQQPMSQLVQKQKKTNKPVLLPNSYIFGQAFVMTFLAQWGDRSQIATIALAASFNVMMVILGSVLGHLICTFGAVQLGQWISGRVKEKYLLLSGGIVFILSGFATLYMVFAEDDD